MKNVNNMSYEELEKNLLRLLRLESKNGKLTPQQQKDYDMILRKTGKMRL